MDTQQIKHNTEVSGPLSLLESDIYNMTRVQLQSHTDNRGGIRITSYTLLTYTLQSHACFSRIISSFGISFSTLVIMSMVPQAVLWRSLRTVYTASKSHWHLLKVQKFVLFLIMSRPCSDIYGMPGLHPATRFWVGSATSKWAYIIIPGSMISYEGFGTCFFLGGGGGI